MNHYYVNDQTRLVRCEACELPNTATYQAWREVTSKEWDAFRLETKQMKKKGRK